jgi:hypothetical protein
MLGGIRNIYIKYIIKRQVSGVCIGQVVAKVLIVMRLGLKV